MLHKHIRTKRRFISTHRFLSCIISPYPPILYTTTAAEQDTLYRYFLGVDFFFL